jgi:16S rRNA (guanine(1405)-N(7))-methyltransferase
MEQIEHGLSQRILEGLNARHILVTYPLRSLGGRRKGMEETYRSQFNELVAGRDWSVQEFSFPNEVAYLVTK